jgi:hypothetical protein
LPSIIGPGDEHPSPAIQIKDYTRVKQGFAAADPRYIGTNGQIINTAGTVAKPWIGSDPSELRSGYFNVKTWRDPLVVNSNDSLFGDQGVPMLRLGEILVSKAEAQFKTGDAAGAMTTIQQIRDRAWGKLETPSVVVPPPVETDMMKIILDVRHENRGNVALDGSEKNWRPYSYMLINTDLHPRADVIPPSNCNNPSLVQTHIINISIIILSKVLLYRAFFS